MTASLRDDYLTALGLEPLVLRATHPLRGDVADAADRVPGAGGGDARAAAARAAAALSGSAEPAARGRREISAQDATPHARPAQTAVALSSHPDARGGVDGLFAPRPPRLRLAPGDAVDLSGPHADLLRALVRALGVGESEVQLDARSPLSSASADGVQDPLPCVAFGDPSLDADVHAPALAQLRGPRAKRALWPALRRLRRHLHNNRYA